MFFCHHILNISVIIHIFTDNSVLQTLNTGAVKDLQKLQTVGSKRAHLIYDYRELNGNFHTVSIIVRGVANFKMVVVVTIWH